MSAQWTQAETATLTVTVIAQRGTRWRAVVAPLFLATSTTPYLSAVHIDYIW